MALVRMCDASLNDLKADREEYIAKYIGDFNKPTDYEDRLWYLNFYIKVKETNSIICPYLGRDGRPQMMPFRQFEKQEESEL